MGSRTSETRKGTIHPVDLNSKLYYLEATYRDNIQGMLISTSIGANSLYDLRPEEVPMQH